MNLNEKDVLNSTLEIEQGRLVGLQEHKFLLVSFCKNTDSVDKEIKECKESITTLESKINKL